MKDVSLQPTEQQQGLVIFKMYLFKSIPGSILYFLSVIIHNIKSFRFTLDLFSFVSCQLTILFYVSYFVHWFRKKQLQMFGIKALLLSIILNIAVRIQLAWTQL